MTFKCCYDKVHGELTLLLTDFEALPYVSSLGEYINAGVRSKGYIHITLLISGSSAVCSVLACIITIMSVVLSNGVYVEARF